MLYYLVAALYVTRLFRDDARHPAPAGQGRRHRQRVRRRSAARRRSARAAAPPCCRARRPICAMLFMVGALALGIIGQRGPGSVIGGRAPLTQPSTPAPAPPTRRRRRHRRHRQCRRAPQHRHRRSSTFVAAGLPWPDHGRRQTRRPSTRKWRNWQTHQLEGLAVAIPWGFESPLPHQDKRPGFPGLFIVDLGKANGWLTSSPA